MGLPVVVGGLLLVLVYAEALLIAQPQQADGPCPALLGSFLEPVDGLLAIRLDTDAPVVAVPQIALGLGVAGLGGLPVKGGRSGPVHLHAVAGLIAEAQSAQGFRISIFSRSCQLL